MPTSTTKHKKYREIHLSREEKKYEEPLKTAGISFIHAYKGNITSWGDGKIGPYNRTSKIWGTEKVKQNDKDDPIILYFLSTKYHFLLVIKLQQF